MTGKHLLLKVQIKGLGVEILHLAQREGLGRDDHVPTGPNPQLL